MGSLQNAIDAYVRRGNLSILRRRTCGRKRRYATRAQAMVVAQRMGRAGEGHLEAYLCPWCAEWHVGHPKPRKGQRKD